MRYHVPCQGRLITLRYQKWNSQINRIDDVLVELLKETNPYSLNSATKQQLLDIELLRLTALHVERCSEYKNILSAYNIKAFDGISNHVIPALPVRLFKLNKLKSIAEEDVFKVLTSSGTTSQVLSRIYLDRETASWQTKVLVNIMQSYIS